MGSPKGTPDVGVVLAEVAHEDVDLHDPCALIETAKAVSPIAADGTVMMHIIRPGIGKGQGRRYYGPQMLAENAAVFTGKRMFIDHETAGERRARGHLPRTASKLAGRILESHWDGSVPPTERFEQGAVVAKVRLLRNVREVVEDDPEILEASINALATKVTPGQMKGQSVAIVEGIRPDPITVDFIAGEGGAGGRILLEAAYEEYDHEAALIETMTDEEFQEWMAAERPGLLEALRESSDTDRHEEDRVEITSEALVEALTSDEGKVALSAALQEALQEVRPGLDESAIAQLVESRVEARIAEERDLLRLDAATVSNRRIELSDMRTQAHALIESSQLHPTLKTRLKSNYALTESGLPSAALDVTAETDDDGVVTRSAREILEATVTEEIKDSLSLQASLAAPTRVRGQGRMQLVASGDERLQEAAGGSEDGKSQTRRSRPGTGSPLTDSLLQKAGFQPESLPSIWSAA